MVGYDYNSKTMLIEKENLGSYKSEIVTAIT
jgi:hypothetical protein